MVFTPRQFTIVLCLVATMSTRVVAGRKEETKLFRDLFANYSADFRPCSNCSQPLLVNLGVKPYKLLEVSEVKRLIKLKAWYRETWTDPTLSWNSSLYGGLERINVQSNLLWTPRSTLLNSLESQLESQFSPPKDDRVVDVILHSNGKVFLAAPVVLTVACYMDMSAFPFDVQQCNFMFGSLYFSDEELQYTINKVYSLAHDTGEEITVGLWKLTSFEVRELKRSNDTSSSIVSFSVLLSRKARYYVVVLILPLFANCILCLLIFLLPAESGERVAVGVNTLITMWVNYIRALKGIPKSPTLPMFCKFYNLMMLQNLVTIGISSLLIYFFHMNVNIELPGWVKSYVLDKLARVVFIRDMVQQRLSEDERLRLQATYFRSRFQGRSFHRIAIGLNLFVNNSLKDFETFWRREEWRLVSLVLERLFTYLLVLSTLFSFLVFGVLASNTHSPSHRHVYTPIM